jgi:type III secretion system FlhB-like substrate exporter
LKAGIVAHGRGRVAAEILQTANDAVLRMTTGRRRTRRQRKAKSEKPEEWSIYSEKTSPLEG